MKKYAVLWLLIPMLLTSCGTEQTDQPAQTIETAERLALPQSTAIDTSLEKIADIAVTESY